jgi:PAS domain S-box-containing protein
MQRPGHQRQWSAGLPYLPYLARRATSLCRWGKVMMNFKRHLVAALLVLVLGCLVGVGWLIYSDQRAELESERWERHSREVIQQLGALLSCLKDAETGQRGFIITGKPDYLWPYQASLAEITVDLADLLRLTADNPQQQQRLHAITPLVAAKLAELKETIALRESQGFPVASAAFMVESGKKIMDEIRALVAQAEAQEAQLLKERVATHAADNRKTMQSVTLGSALGGLALLLLFIRFRWALASRQRAHTSLRASEQRLRVATDAAELGIWTWQSDGDRITWENDRPYAILGLPRSDAPLTAARFAAEFVHSEDLAAFKQAMASTAKNRARFFFQGRFHCPDGALRWIEFTGQAVPGPNWPSLRVIGTVQDITERKHAEELVARQAVELATLYTSAPVGLFFYDTDLRYVHVNPAMADLNGLPAEQHIGRTLRDILTPELADAVEPQVRQVLETGRPLLNCEVHGATAPRAGEQQRHWLVSYHPVQAGDGTLRGVHGAVQEITERKQAEQLLRQNHDTFFNLIQSAPFGLYVVDAQFRLRQVSTASLKMFSNIDPLIGSDFEEVLRLLWPESFASEAIRRFRHTLQTGEPYAASNTTEQRQNIPDIESYDWKIERITLPDGQLGVVCYFYDITERSRLERKTLEQAQTLADLDRRKDEFLAMLGHELRNPLAALSNAAQLLRRHQHEDALQRQGRSIIERQVGQLTNLVDDLLEVSRITSGNVRLHLQPVSISGVVERAVETAQPLMAQRRHQLTVSLPPQPLWLRADAARLEQVVVNLLTNAAKYTDEGGRIVLSVAQEGDGEGSEAVLRVRDNGIGIAPDLLPHIFELFTQAERSLDRSQGGLGIGLSLVQRLVGLHGGSVKVQSILGQGCEFVVRLPLMPLMPLMPTAPAPLAPPLLALDAAQPPANGCRVLVVDDNVDAAQSLARLLEMTGHEVRLAYDGPSVLEAALDHRPEVVLLDIGLPGLDGFEVAQQIRQEAALSSIVLVALTGYGQNADRQQSQEAGFDHHLVKPASFSEIEQILSSVSRQVKL